MDVKFPHIEMAGRFERDDAVRRTTLAGTMQLSTTQSAQSARSRHMDAARSSLAERAAPSCYFVVGQLGWFACVLSAAHGMPWMGVALAIVLVALHVVRVARPADELKLILTVVLLGAVWESGLVAARLLQYPVGNVIPDAAPYWLLALWALFAAQLNTTFGWLRHRLVLAALLGACAGPMSFRAGAALGAVRFVHPWPAIAALAAGWAVLMPVLMLLSRRWDGVHQQ